MFVVILFLLGLSFGFAVKMPWALLAFVVPVLLALAAQNRSAGAMVLGFAVTGGGILVGLLLSTRTDERTA
jgi:hypothetical protein